MAHTKGTLFALILTLTGVLIFALVVQFAGLGSGVIKITSQIIKVISIFLGVFFVVKHVQRFAWLHGAVLGLVYTVLAFFIFSILDNNFSITSGLMFDSIFALVVGALSAMLLRFRNRNI